MKEITLTTWNAGNGSNADFKQLLRQGIILAGQEWGDQRDMTNVALDQDWKILDGSGKAGQSSTPLFYQPHSKNGAKLLHRYAYSMIRSQNVGPGAGPSRLKAKWAIGGRFNLQGHHFNAVSTHLVASQEYPLRHKVAVRHVDHLLDAFNQRSLPTFIMGDFNAVPDSDTLDALYRHGWTNSHIAGGDLNTHGSRSIDYVWWKKSAPIRFVEHHTLKNGSDHNALVATFKLL
jgi:endonuclease/exonuclease/phosphatase family metal-dependent hydrolase